jgi:hypothetical protein
MGPIGTSGWAWAAHRDGLDFCPLDEYWPEAHRLAERGWLERRWVDVGDHRGDLVFMWTPQAEAALDIASLMSKASPN